MSNRLADLRRKNKMSQATLAVKANISRPYISNIETGKQVVISNDIMQRLSNALGESIVDIFFTANVMHEEHVDTA